MGMSQVTRQIKDSLDGMPVHVRQLAEMFRKHGQKQQRNTGRVDDLDATDVPEALRDGWKKDSWHTPDRVVGTGKSNRPYPAEYLDADYIEQHIRRFDGGATRFYKQDSLGKYGPGNAGTTFVFPTSEIDSIIESAGGNRERLGEMLGLGKDFFEPGTTIVRADFSYDEIAGGNLRMPRGNEGGANAQWIPGGYLPEGIPEAVFTVNPSSTGANPSVGGTWGQFSEFTP
ncbi:hypothetical protein AB3M83_12285 [Microbacterium sp. 179-B 1A2 NHS]|uniref:hypothetical protein n=1 Tax=Microbacterium sp. 179-B 1A2 NHS TaxID=3142383 RepID=UPI0039A226A6